MFNNDNDLILFFKTFCSGAILRGCIIHISFSDIFLSLCLLVKKGKMGKSKKEEGELIFQ